MTSSITVISPTKRPHMIGRLLKNFARQTGPMDRKLIICLHGIEPFDHDVIYAKELKSVSFLYFSSSASLGDLLNRAGFEVSTVYACKWDDDDFYGNGFLLESINALELGLGALVGKGGWRAWMETESRLYSRFAENCCCHLTYLAGGTLACASENWLRFGFPAVNLGEDQAFVRKFLAQGLPVWSTTVYNYVQYRGINHADHTWSISDSDYIIGAELISNRLDYSLIDKEF